MKSQFLKTLTLAVILLGLTTSPLFAQLGIKSVGSVQKKDGPMQVTVVFSEPVDPASGAAIANYSLGAGVTINAASMMTGLPGLNEPGNGDPPLRGRVIDNQCVVLEVTGLGTATTTLTVSGVKSTDLSQTLNTSTTFVPSGYTWVELGQIYTQSSHPGWVAPGRKEGKVIADSDAGFDIFNNGRTGWAGTDEFTFAYKPVNGDFEFKSRLEFADSASRWSRAGIMVRERIEQGTTPGCFGRYMTAHADPPRAFSDTAAGVVAGNNTYESNARVVDYSDVSPVCGDGTHTDFAADTVGGGGGVPQYPIAWVRLARQGDTITADWSNDGVTWTVLSTRTFDPPLPATLYWGPAYCAEWANINAANGDAARSRYYLTQHRWGQLTTPYVVTVTGSPMGFVATVQNLQTRFVPATLQMWLDDVSVTATSVVGPDAGGLTTITYTAPAILATGPHSVKIQFNDNNAPVPNLITKESTFDVAYVAVPVDYATTTFSGTRGNMMVSAHKMPLGSDGFTQLVRGLGNNTVAAVETELQDGFLDPVTGLPVANDVAGTPEELAGVINYSENLQAAGYFNAFNVDVNGQVPDSNWMPTFVDGDNYALQFYGYAQLPAGAYRMFVNSDDGFKLSFGPNALDVIGMRVGAFDSAGGRGHTLDADPTAGGFDFVITQAGVYPFRLIYGEATGDASIEWYMLNSAGTRVLINDAAAPVQTYPTGRGRAYLKKFLPYPGANGVDPRPTLTFQVVDDLTTVADSTIKVILDGTDISSSVIKQRSGGTLTVTWTPAADYPFESQHTGQFIYTENSGTSRTNDINFTIKGFVVADLPTSSFWIEVEDFDFDRGKSLPVADTAIGTDPATAYTGGGYADLVGQGFLPAVLDIDYHKVVGPTNADGTLGGYLYRTDIPGWANPPDNTVPGFFVPLGNKLDAGVANTRPGPVTVTVNYNTAWSGSSWYNYTRTVPNGTYNVFLAACHWNNTDPPADGQIDSTLDKVTAGVGTTTQTLQRLGSFRAPANGTTETLTMLKGSDGSAAVLKFNGKTTLRLSVNAGDSDYLVLAPASGVAAKLTSAAPAEGALVARDDTVRLAIEDFSTTVVQNSVKLYFDNVDVTAQTTVTKPADITTVTYDPTGVMSIGAHSYRLEFRDSASASFTNTINFTAVAVGVPNQFLIEAEDFNTGGGQTVAGASTMPYTGNLYNGLNATFDVDYHSTETLTPDVTASDDGWVAVYRSGAPITPNTEMPLNDNLGGRLGQLRGATWQVTVNYKIGWTGGSDWANYTRNIPTGNYEVYAALSGDTGANPIAGALDLVTGDITQPNQATTRLGVFSAPATGGWGNNVMVPMTESGAGSPKVISLGTPPTTLRFYPQNGDFDFLVLQPSSATPAPTIDVATNPQGQPVLTFTGALLSADTITGPYAPVAGATSPYTVTGAGTGNKFYRTSNP